MYCGRRSRGHLCFEHVADADLCNLSATISLFGNRFDADLRGVRHWQGRDTQTTNSAPKYDVWV